MRDDVTYIMTQKVPAIKNANSRRLTGEGGGSSRTKCDIYDCLVSVYDLLYFFLSVRRHVSSCAFKQRWSSGARMT